MAPSRLGVVIDGTALPEDEARAFWGRFSAYMEAHKGDLAGFARAEGLASIFPEMRGGQAVLVASRTAPQRPYAPAKTVPAQRPPGKPPSGGPHPKAGKKRK